MAQKIVGTTTTTTQRLPSIRRKWWKEIWSQRSWYLMLLPGLVFFILFKYLPMYGVIISFKDYDLLEGIWNSPWADPWYKHFEYFYQSTYFTQLLTNTLLISVYKIVFGMAPDIVMALLLNECRKAWFKRSVQTLTYMPHFLSWVIIYGIAYAFLSETTGVLNRWIEAIGFDTIPFLSSTDWFRSVLVGSEIWKDIGWGAIIYLAAMSSIDPSLYEAARVDGASRLRMMWHITLPSITHVFVLLLVLRLGHVLDAGFEQIYVMYNVRVYPVSDIIDTWVYRTGLEQLNFSLASAVGLFKSFIGLWLVLGANAIAKRWGQGIW